jgi:uncharacterized protein (TIGR03435 family)
VVHPVVDSTGLEGGYNFVLSWTPKNKLVAAPAAAPSAAGAPTMPADPSGLSVFEALDRQLGLKLDEAKKPMQVLIIDKANQLPTEN